MNADELVETVFRAGGTVQSDGTEVRVRAPKDVLTPAMLELLRTHRSQIMAIVSKTETGTNAIQPNSRIRLDDFAVARLSIAIFSEVVDEKVYFASDNAELQTDNTGLYRGRVVYRASELRALAQCCAETIKTIHAVKKLMGGHVTPDSD